MDNERSKRLEENHKQWAEHVREICQKSMELVEDPEIFKLIDIKEDASG